MRVVLVEDHVVVRELLSAAFREFGTPYRVVGEAGTAREGIAACREHRPDLVILDLNLPGGVSGLDALPALRKAAPRARVLIFTGSVDEDQIAAALRAGPDGFVEKTSPLAELRLALDRVMAGERYLCPRSERVFDELRRGRRGGLAEVSPDVLSPRERQTLTLVAGGRTNKEVAARLHMEPKTAATHRANAMRKLNLHNAADLTRYAVRHGLISAG